MERPPPPDPNPGETYHPGRKRGQTAWAGLLVGVATAASFLRWRPSRIEVRGPSMGPALLPSDWALAVAPRKLRRGHVVVIEHPERPGLEMVKRLVALPGDVLPDGRCLGPDEWWVEGDDHEHSTDSRQFGPVRRDAILAKVRLIYWPADRRRLL